MKNYLVVIMFFLATAVLFSQKKSEITVYRNNEAVIEGRGWLKGNKKVRVFESGKMRSKDYKLQILDKVIVKEQVGNKTYRFLEIDGKKRPMILEELISGIVSLYKIEILRGGGGMVNGSPSSLNYRDIDYFVVKEHMPRAYPMGSSQLFSKSFQKDALDFFSDCPELIKRIKIEGLDRKDIELIVQYYNTNCQ